MYSFLRSITSITGPLTLVAFFGVIFLAAYRYTVVHGRGLEHLHSLLNAKIGKKDFYRIVMRGINLTFIFLLIVTALSLSAWIIGKLIDANGRAEQLNKSTQAYQEVQDYKANKIDEKFEKKIDEVMSAAPSPANEESVNSSTQSSPENIFVRNVENRQTTERLNKVSESKVQRKEKTESQIEAERRELANYLENRSQKIINEMADQQTAALRSRDAGLGIKRMSREELLTFLEKGRLEFKTLHAQHLTAIKTGNYILARETLTDIHHLLNLYESTIFKEAYKDPNDQYSSRIVVNYAKDYVGTPAQRILRSKVAKSIFSCSGEPAIYFLHCPEYYTLDKERTKKVLDEMEKIQLNQSPTTSTIKPKN